MGATVAFKGATGFIYRLKAVESISDLPHSAGIYCFTAPQEYPGAPIEPVYWGRASTSLCEEIRRNKMYRAALSLGAPQIWFMEVHGRLARRRAILDLLEARPTVLNNEDPQDLMFRPRRTSRWSDAST